MTKVTLHDPKATNREMVLWAEEHCESYQRYRLTDVSDISVDVDLICEYWFNDDTDAAWFALRWG